MPVLNDRCMSETNCYSLPLSVMSHISLLCHMLKFFFARKKIMDTYTDLYTHTSTRSNTRAFSHTYAAVTVHESHTTKHRWYLERDIVVGCQEWYRREAKSTVQPVTALAVCKSILRGRGSLKLTAACQLLVRFGFASTSVIL